MFLKKYKNSLESVVKSQNIVEQVNSNPNNISPTMSRRHIIWKSSIFAEMNQKFSLLKKIQTCAEWQMKMSMIMKNYST